MLSGSPVANNEKPRNLGGDFGTSVGLLNAFCLIIELVIACISIMRLFTTFYCGYFFPSPVSPKPGCARGRDFFSDQGFGSTKTH